MEIIGIRAVVEALEREQSWIRLVVEDKNAPRLSEAIALAESRGVRIVVDRNYFQKFTRAAQGIALEIPEYNYWSLDQLLALPQEERESICILDSIQDVGNLGSIVRSASCFGISAIILSKDRSAKITPAVYKTAQGGLEDVPVVQVVNVARALRDLKEAGYWVAACHMEGEDVSHVPQGPVAFIIGSEHSGIRPGVLKEADYTLTIPMDSRSSVGCLNAATAASILFYEYFQRSKK